MLIMQSAVLMLTAIEFDHQFGLKARKIGDIAGNRDLSAKAISGELATSQVVPEKTLCIGSLVS
jgi:hypothetical protein